MAVTITQEDVKKARDYLPAGAQDAYNKGDRVWFPEKDTKIYESLIDANVYSPEAYPAGWKEIS